MNRPLYKEARSAILAIHAALKEINQSAAGSLLEGLDEPLTLHRLRLSAWWEARPRRRTCPGINPGALFDSDLG
jgi:hypothetical protein